MRGENEAGSTLGGLRTELGQGLPIIALSDHRDMRVP